MTSDCTLVLREGDRLTVYFLVKHTATRTVTPYWQAPIPFSLDRFGQLVAEEGEAPDLLMRHFQATLGQPFSPQLLQHFLVCDSYPCEPFQQHPELNNENQLVFFSFCSVLRAAVNRALQNRENAADLLYELLSARAGVLSARAGVLESVL